MVCRPVPLPAFWTTSPSQEAIRCRQVNISDITLVIVSINRYLSPAGVTPPNHYRREVVVSGWASHIQICAGYATKWRYDLIFTTI